LAIPDGKQIVILLLYSHGIASDSTCDEASFLLPIEVSSRVNSSNPHILWIGKLDYFQMQILNKFYDYLLVGATTQHSTAGVWRMNMGKIENRPRVPRLIASSAGVAGGSLTQG